MTDFFITLFGSFDDWQDVVVVLVAVACLGYAMWWVATWGRH